MNPRRQRALDFYRLMVANTDFGVAETSAKMMQQFCDANDHSAFSVAFYAFVISYAKPFVGSKHVGPLKKEWSKFDSEDFRNAHNEILDWRNTMIAHNDPTIVEPILLPPGCEIRVNGEIRDELTEMCFAVRYKVPQIERLKLYQSLIEYQRSRVLDRLAEEKDTLFDAASLPHGPFALTIDFIQKIT